ncbi:rod shape-determining protein RodA [Candidatus Daviesbacteria bacterium]|nr:rod shape-determining protein RodA [Candidatus Daviesbacteria bacterium]
MDVLSKINWPITIASLLLLSFGILVIYSSSPELALQQVVFTFVGLVLYFLMSLSDYRSLRGLIFPSYIFVIILLIIVLILGIETRGSVRWIPLGPFNMQPSELAKPILILFLALFWEKRLPSWHNIAKSLLWTLPCIFLIFKQPDLGSSLTVLAIWIGVLFAAKISYKKVLLILLIALVLSPIFWLSLHEYQKQRISSFLSPQNDPLGLGYNLIQSTIAVGSGQLTGRGLGQGTQSRLQFLPEFRTDFIFASIAEEMGFVGSLIIILLYMYIISYSLRISQNSSDNFGLFIVFGVVSMVLFQSFVNIGMNIGLLPITGITLPLISYGGSSLIATLISLGLVGSVARFRKRIDIPTFGG